MIPLLLALTGPGLADSAVPSAAMPAEEPAPAVLMGEVLSPEEYSAWVVGYTDAMGLAWHRALARLDPDGGPEHLARVLAQAEAELAYAQAGLARVPAFSGDASLPQAGAAYGHALGRTLHEALPVLLELLSQELPDDQGLARAEAVWAALVQRGAEHQAALDHAQAAFAARRSSRPAPSLLPWEALAAWQGPPDLALPGPMAVVLAARRHNALVRRQQALVDLWSRLAQAPQQAPRIRSELAEHRAMLEQAGPLAGHDGLRRAVLAYAETLEATAELPRQERAPRLRQAHRDFDQALVAYQAFWRFEDYLAWAIRG